MFKDAILSIISPKGTINGPAFLVNLIIIRLVSFIVNIIAFYIDVNDYLAGMPIRKIIVGVLSVITLLLITIAFFNYTKRFRDITENLIVSIIFGIIFSFGLDILISFFLFNLPLFFINLIVIPCLIAVIPAKRVDKKDYWKSFIGKIYSFIKNPITIFVIIMIFIDVLLVQISVYKNKQIVKIQPTESMENLVINPLSSFNGMSKDKIIELRKTYVSTSIFNKNYTPNMSIFEGISEEKPWWGLNHTICYDKISDDKIISEGVSEESRFLNNPNMLVGVRLNQIFEKSFENINLCNDEKLLMIPQKINYDKKNKLIIINFKGSENFTKSFNKKRAKFTLTGLNAKELGYNYMFVLNSKNAMFLPFSVSIKPISEQPKKILEKIMIGNACGTQNGCNNAGPFQPEMQFYFKDLPAEITLSLWKSKPLFKNQPADMYVKLIFD